MGFNLGINDKVYINSNIIFQILYVFILIRSLTFNIWILVSFWEQNYASVRTILLIIFLWDIIADLKYQISAFQNELNENVTLNVKIKNQEIGSKNNVL